MTLPSTDAPRNTAAIMPIRQNALSELIAKQACRYVAFRFNTSFVRLSVGLAFLMPMASWVRSVWVPVALCLVVVLGGPLFDRPHWFTSFHLSQLAWLVLLGLLACGDWSKSRSLSFDRLGLFRPCRACACCRLRRRPSRRCVRSGFWWWLSFLRKFF